MMDFRSKANFSCIKILEFINSLIKNLAFQKQL